MLSMFILMVSNHNSNHIGKLHHQPARIFTQPKFLLHDGIAAGIFNASYCGASSSDPWNSHLQNSPELLELFLKRMQSDFEGQNVKMRKPWALKELEPRFKTKNGFVISWCCIISC